MNATVLVCKLRDTSPGTSQYSAGPRNRSRDYSAAEARSRSSHGDFVQRSMFPLVLYPLDESR